MRTIPTAPEILKVVAHYLRDSVATKLSGPDRFYSLVAANAVDIVRRELELGPDADDAARARLRALLDRDGQPEAMETDLAEAIANGSLPIESEALRQHLLATALDEVAIDQPRYASAARLQQAVKDTRPQKEREA